MSENLLQKRNFFNLKRREKYGLINQFFVLPSPALNERTIKKVEGVLKVRNI